MFSALLRGLKAINTNISTMHNDTNMVDDGQLDLDSIVSDRGAGDEGETNVIGEGEEHASVVSEASVDAQVAHLLASQQTAREQTAVTSRTSLSSSIAQDLIASEKTGKAVQTELANIVTSLFKEKLPDDKDQAKLDKYPRPENIKNLKTPRVNPLIWNNISASARSVDFKYQKLQQSLLGAIGAIVHVTDHAIKNRYA